jgi:hypothetical protein
MPWGLVFNQYITAADAMGQTGDAALTKTAVMFTWIDRESNVISTRRYVASGSERFRAMGWTLAQEEGFAKGYGGETLWLSPPP